MPSLSLNHLADHFCQTPDSTPNSWEAEARLALAAREGGALTSDREEYLLAIIEALLPLLHKETSSPPHPTTPLLPTMCEIPGEAFQMANAPVTFAEYDRFCNATAREKPSDYDWGRGDRPVININYYDACDYIDWLNTQTGQCFSLPTSEQWEIAARGNSFGDYCFDPEEETLEDYAWFFGNSNRQTHPICRKKANVFGLYDVHGNVGEWTSSITHDDSRVLRGGSWFSHPSLTRLSYSSSSKPNRHYAALGFRVCRRLGNPSPK